MRDHLMASWVVTLFVATAVSAPCNAQKTTQKVGAKDSVTIRVVNTELRSAVQFIGQYLDWPVIYSGPVGAQVTLETPHPVARSTVPTLLRGLLESQSYELIPDTAAQLFRARPHETPKPPVVSPGDAGSRQATPPAQPASSTELFVIGLKHARAADVAATVNALYGRGTSDGSSVRRSTLSDELRANQVPPVGAPPSPPITITQGAQRGSAFTGEVIIVPDPRGNTLLVRANRTDYTLIEQVVGKLDVRPLQVLIEVLIAEVRRDRSLTFGVTLKLPKTNIAGTENTTIAGSIDGLGSGGTGAGGLGEFALSVMGIGGLDLEATIKAAAGRGDVSILSRPIVLTANNQEAEINVGSQRPFVQVSRSLPTDAAVRDQVVQYKDVGTKLAVRPTISVDGSVQLEVKQEVSSATTETAFNAPVISTRSVTTQLLILDGQTVVLGGLTDRQRDVSQSGIPLLSSIPFIGGLFGSASRRTTETELFIFLTPHVIRSDDDAAQLSAPLRERATRSRP